MPHANAICRIFLVGLTGVQNESCGAMWSRSFAADPCTKFEMANGAVINPVDASRRQVRGT